MNRLPLWLKWFLGLVVCSIIFPFFAEIPELLLFGVVLLLILFPGKNPVRPRLFVVAPWAWGLSCAVSVAFLVLWYMNPGFFNSNPQLQEVRLSEIWLGVIFPPILLVLFAKRHPLFRVAIVLSSLATSLGVFQGEPFGVRSLLEVTTEVILVVYFLKHFRPAHASSAGSPRP